MGILTDLAGVIASDYPAALDRSARQKLLSTARKLDPELTVENSAKDETFHIPVQTSSGVGDTYTLTFEFYGRLRGVKFTTNSIVYSSNEGPIESAINSKASAAIPGWIDSDILAIGSAGNGLSDGTLDFEFSASVAGVPCVVTLTPTGWATDGTPSRTVKGQGERPALQALFALGFVTGTVHHSPEVPTDWARPETSAKGNRQLIYDLANLASIEDGTDAILNTVLALYPKAK